MDDHICIHVSVCNQCKSAHYTHAQREISFLFSRQLVGQLRMEDNHSSPRTEGNGNKRSNFSHLQRAESSCLHRLGGNGVWGLTVEVEKMRWKKIWLHWLAFPLCFSLLWSIKTVAGNSILATGALTMVGLCEAVRTCLASW